jgi:hypothetical protein
MPNKYQIPEKMKEYHSVCINFKKLKVIRGNTAANFSKKVLTILPEITKKFEMYKKLNMGKPSCNPEIFLKNEIDDYFQKNFKKCAMYLAWKKKIKKTF